MYVFSDSSQPTNLPSPTPRRRGNLYGTSSGSFSYTAESDYDTSSTSGSCTTTNYAASVSTDYSSSYMRSEYAGDYDIYGNI